LTVTETAAGTGTAGLSPLRDPVILRLASVVILGSVMSVLDTTIVNVAVTTLARDFKSPVSTIQWVVTGYMLALAVAVPLTGWTIERFGAKRMWLISLALFTGGSILCGAAWSPSSLIAFRVLQGLGGGLIMPIGQTIMARAAGPQRMARVMSVLGVPTMLAPVFGPVIGGFIVDSLSWRWIFYVNVPVGIVAAFLSLRFLRPEHDERQIGTRLDVLGVVLLSPGLALLVYGLSRAASGSGVHDGLMLGCLATGLLLVVLFVVHARRVPDPLLDMRLFRDRGFSLSSLNSFVVGIVLFGAMFILPIYYQVVRGESTLVAGLLLAPQGLGAALSMPLGGRLTDRVGPGRVVPVGLAVVILGTIPYALLDPSSSYAVLAGALFVRGLGFGWTLMPAMAAAYRNLSRAAVPRATTTLNIVLRVGGSFGTALVAVVLQRQISERLPHGAASVLQGNTPQSPALRTSTAASRHISEALAASFGYTFWVLLAITFVGLAGSLFLPRGPAIPIEPLDPERRGETVPAAGADLV
jgi:EmrB/QacA subfamily drug resistance transporter